MSRLSEDIMLGSGFVKLNPTLWLSSGGECGCLIGMGLKARFATAQSMHLCDVLSAYPWLSNQFSIPPSIRHHPYIDSYAGESVVWGPAPLAGHLRAWQIISIMASQVLDHNMTLEQAVDWVCSVEPVETEPESTQVCEEKALVNA